MSRECRHVSETVQLRRRACAARRGGTRVGRRAARIRHAVDEPGCPRRSPEAGGWRRHGRRRERSRARDDRRRARRTRAGGRVQVRHRLGGEQERGARPGRRRDARRGVLRRSEPWIMGAPDLGERKITRRCDSSPRPEQPTARADEDSTSWGLTDAPNRYTLGLHAIRLPCPRCPGAVGGRVRAEYGSTVWSAEVGWDVPWDSGPHFRVPTLERGAKPCVGSFVLAVSCPRWRRWRLLASYLRRAPGRRRCKRRSRR
jgi:hypothetical protein